MSEALRPEFERTGTNQVPYGPLLEGGMVTAGLDYYKPTMSQLIYEQEPDTEVTFTFHNRGEQRLIEYIDPLELQERFDLIRSRGFQPDEIDFFASIKNSQNERVFSDEHLEYLQNNELPQVSVWFDGESDDIAIESTGPWAMATFWETVVMSEVNEAYFDGYLRAHNLNTLEVYQEGDARLSEKIRLLQENPDIKFSDFGTRRHFSLRWQKHVLERLKKECPDNIIGTSNVGLANSLDFTPIGTFAHEMPMGYAALADARGGDIRGSHNAFLEDWYDKYGEDLAIVLPDTFTTKFFFSDFTTEQAELWRGARHDSSDPIEFGENLIMFYEGLGIDPTTKTIVFSDNLDIDTIIKLQRHFKGRIRTLPGWGTNLTNDLGIPPLNVVMKLTHVRTANGLEADAVKLSDSEGKYTGPPDLVENYKNKYFA